MTPTQPPEVNTKQTTRAHHFTTVALTLLLFGLTMLFTVFYTQFQLKRENQHVAQLTETLKEATHLSQDHLQENLTQLNQNTATQVRELHASINQVLQEHAAGQQQWILFKAQYLLELASTNHAWTDDPQTTIAILHAADQLLQTQQGQTITTIRQALAEAISKLAALPKLDVTGTLITLNNMQQQVPRLKSIFTTSTSTSPKPSPVSSQSSTWREHLQSTLDELKTLVVVRHHGDLMPMDLTPDYETIQRAVIQLQLQEAQWAVLHRNPALYMMLLNNAEQAATNLFAQQDQPTIAFMQQLNTLKSITLSSPKPAIDQAYTLLHQWITHQPTKISETST